MSETNTDTKPDEEETEPQVVDVADRLIRIMKRIEATAKDMRFPHPTSPNHQVTGLQCPLHQVFEPLAIELGFTNYAALHDDFVALCRRVIRDVESLTLRRPKTQRRWIQAAQTAESVFNASNFAENCGEVFERHFSDDVYERLEDASERLQNVGKQEASSDELLEALDAARDAMNAYENSGNISPELSKILKHYLQQIEEAYRKYDDFGDEVFWSSYKVLFSTFLQVHPIIIDEDKGDEIKEATKSAMNNMGIKMFYGLRTLSVSADVVTLAAAGTALLQLTN